MTAAALRDDLLSLVGIEDVADAPAALGTRILNDVNAALREIMSNAPNDWLKDSPRSELVRAPTTVTLTVTRDSKSITFADYASWMAGCTIVIAGDDQHNQLMNDVGASVSLRVPYNGPSASGVSATIYHNAINLGTDVDQVLAPVVLDGLWELTPVASPRALASAQFAEYHNSGHGLIPKLYPLVDRKMPSNQPLSYFTDSNSPYLGSMGLRLMLSALPGERMTLSYRASTYWTVTSLASDTRTQFLPFGYDEAILRPWCRWKFSSWPHITIPKAELKAEFDAALAMLEKLKPSQFVETQVYMGGW
jgi:hypothetical protein